jgi:VanZ family protein
LTSRTSTPSIHFWLPLVVWVAAILCVSSIPGPTLAKVGFSVQDKVAHATEYSVLGFLACRWLLGVRVGTLPALLLSALMGAGVGAADESWQLLIPGRTTSIYDWTADLVGAVLGVTAATIYYVVLHRRAAAAVALEQADPRDPEALRLQTPPAGDQG